MEGLNNSQNGTATVKDQQLSAVESPAQPIKPQTTSRTGKVKESRVYSEGEKVMLDLVKATFQKEFTALLDNPVLEAVAYSDHNAIINLTKALANGIDIYMPKVNRQHGKDMYRTGDSICNDGPQALLLVIPVSVALAAGMDVVRFSNDKSTAEIEESGFVSINGNGRLEYILSLEPAERPTLYATFVEPNNQGYYDVPQAMGAINEYLSPWKTQDKMTKKIMEMGTNANSYLVTTRQLVNSGFNYQAACQLTTLKPDRITSTALETGNWDDIFVYGSQATRVREALFKAFGEEDPMFKKKPFTQKICQIFDSLIKSHGGDAEVACSILIDFISTIEAEHIARIKECRKTKGVTAANAEIKRVSILNDMFNRYVGKNDIKIID